MKGDKKHSSAHLQSPPMVADLLRPTRVCSQAVQELTTLNLRGLQRSNSVARLTAHIQQLCMLNIESHMLMPVLLRTMRRLVNAEFAAFCWASEDYRSVDMCLEPAIPEITTGLPEYTLSHEVFCNHTRDAHGVDFETSMRRGRGWSNTARHDRMFVRSFEYQLLWHPARIRHGLESTVVQNGRGWGALTFARPDGAAPFDTGTEKMLAPLSAFVAHAVLNPDRAESFAPKPTEHGIVLVNRAGRILCQSPQGIRLLRQADGRSSLFEPWRNIAPDWLGQVIHKLVRAGMCNVSMPPLIHRRTQWGTFTLRAYPLMDREPALRSATSFAIQIERYEPLVLQIARGAHHLGLTKRQTEICTHLAQGFSRTQIAKRVGVRPASVVDQVRKMYIRFDVHDRNNLLRMLSRAALLVSSELHSLGYG